MLARTELECRLSIFMDEPGNHIPCFPGKHHRRVPFQKAPVVVLVQAVGLVNIQDGGHGCVLRRFEACSGLVTYFWLFTLSQDRVADKP